MAARILQAFGVSSGFVDVFWQHKRGMKTGIWAQMATMGPAIGGIVGAPHLSPHSWQSPRADYGHEATEFASMPFS